MRGSCGIMSTNKAGRFAVEKATDIILVICGTLLCIGGMFSVGSTYRSALGIGLGLLLVVLGLVDKDRVWPFGRKKGGGGDGQE